MKKSLFIMIVVLLLASLVSYAADEVYLLPNLIGASSFLKANSIKIVNNYHPYYIIDDNPKTAWVEGVNGSGINESIRCTFAPEIVTDSLKILIRNGYQKSSKLFLMNNRVKELTVRFHSIQKGKTVTDSVDYPLEDKMDWQVIDLGPQNTLALIEIVIKSVYKGTNYDDTCISDIKFGVSKNTVISPEIQKRVKERYVKWFGLREKKEQFFNNLPNNYPFGSYKESSYQSKLSLSDIEINLSLFNRVFSNTDWSSFISTEDGKNIIRFFDSSGKSAFYSIKNISQMYAPEILSNLLDNYSGFWRLSQLQLMPLKTQDPSSIEVVTIDGKNKRIKYSLVNGESEQLSSLFYNSFGKLIFIDKEADVEDGEICDYIFLQWEKEKVKKVFWISAEEVPNFVQIDMTVFQ